MVVRSGVVPAVGDLVLLPHWTAPEGTWFRVLDVRPGDTGPGWVELEGYLLLPDGTQRLGTHLVKVSDIVVDRR